MSSTATLAKGNRAPQQDERPPGGNDAHDRRDRVLGPAHGSRQRRGHAHRPERDEADDPHPNPSYGGHAEGDRDQHQDGADPGEEDQLVVDPNVLIAKLFSHSGVASITDWPTVMIGDAWGFTIPATKWATPIATPPATSPITTPTPIDRGVLPFGTVQGCPSGLSGSLRGPYDPLKSPVVGQAEVDEDARP